jgi:PGF-CTERM protein
MTNTTTTMYGRILVMGIVCSMLLWGIGGMGVGAGKAIVPGDDYQEWDNHTLFSSSSPSLEAVAIESLTVQTAPGSTFEYLDTVSNVSTFATNDEKIATGDVLIFRLSSSELSDALDMGSGSPESRFLELVQSGVIDLQIRQTNVTSDTAKTFNLSATIENGGCKVLYSENVVYVAIDTEKALFDQGGTTVHVEPGDWFEATFTGHSSNWTETKVSEIFQIVPRTVSFDTQEIHGQEVVVVEASPNQTVTGETTVAPGTDLTIQAKSNGKLSFVITQTTQVREDRTFSLDFDFTNVTQGISFKLTIPNQGFEDNASTPGIVQRPPTASIQASIQKVSPRNNQTVIIRSVNLSEGGFVSVYDRSFVAGDNGTAPFKSHRGTSQYLPPGKHTNVTVTLDRPYRYNGTVMVVPHLDTNHNKEYDFTMSNGDEDIPYHDVNGDPIVTSANITILQTGDGTGTATGSGVGTGDSTGPGTTGSNPPPQVTDTASLTDSSVTSGSNGTTTASNNTAGSNASENGSETSANSTASTTRSTELNTNNKQMTEAQGPGFGFVIGVVALCVAALLARRNS